MFNQQVFFGPDDLHRSNPFDAGTWSHREAIITLSGQVITGVLQCIDDFDRASAASGIGMHGTTVTHGGSRKRIAADRGPDGGKFQRTTERTKLRGSNQYPQ